VDGAVSQEVGVGGGVEDSATEADFAAVAVADLEVAVVAVLETGEAVLGTEVVSGAEVEVAFEVGVTMATGRFKD